MTEAPAGDERSGCDRQHPSVMLLLRSLDQGGTQRQVVLLARALSERGWRVSVACFYGGGTFEHDIRRAGVSLYILGKRGRWDLAGPLVRMLRLLRRERPAVLHGYLPVPNLLASSMRLFSPGLRVVWGLRAAELDYEGYDWLQRLSYWAERRLSRTAHAVIANSQSGADLRVSQGILASRIHVIPNGIELRAFRFDVEGRKRLRCEWGVPESATLIGHVARLDPIKDHSTFLEAAAALSECDGRFRFACIGGGPEPYRRRLAKRAADLGLAGRLVWAGARSDMRSVYSAFDIALSCSFGEGFPNAVAEAMACGRPCVVTDVGDSAAIVRELGIVVPPRDPAALAEGVRQLLRRLKADEANLRSAVRGRIAEEFSVANLAERTAAVLSGRVSPR